jgi:hypothetical protein
MYFIKKEAVYRHCSKQPNRGWPIQAHEGLSEEEKNEKKPAETNNRTTTETQGGQIPLNPPNRTAELNLLKKRHH